MTASTPRQAQQESTAAPVLAVDVGGTKIEAALVDPAGTVIAGTRIRVPTGAESASSASAFSDALHAAVSTAADHPLAAGVARAGIGAAGPVDLREGTISPINLPAVHDFDIVGAVKSVTGIEDVRLRLDGTCIALGELWRGAAEGARNAIAFVVSTGIGGGVIADGRVVTGESGNAGHLGQVVIDSPVDGDVFGATVEGQASGKYAVAWARQQGWRGETGENLGADAAAGSEVARAAIERSVQALGKGLASAANLLNTEIAVMGGGFSHVTADYAERVQAAARLHSVNAYARELRVVRAQLGRDAPLIGAAALVLRPDLLA
ncbi:ROK family protein [uncultured Agrococcus sp.]|uniref:ROK family protein n=1 Tax=uncultured Agrococcus sp. TaxID=382258 RepID=UPI0025D1F456|nr:ROK family protein [uncultured Agrococcus sp.]